MLNLIKLYSLLFTGNLCMMMGPKTVERENDQERIFKNLTKTAQPQKNVFFKNFLFLLSLQKFDSKCLVLAKML